MTKTKVIQIYIIKGKYETITKLETQTKKEIWNGQAITQVQEIQIRKNRRNKR